VAISASVLKFFSYETDIAYGRRMRNEKFFMNKEIECERMKKA